MSRTIITNSGTNFFTNINSEQLIGELCKFANTKHYVSPIFKDEVSLAYSMTEEETKEVAEKLNKLKEQSDTVFPQVKHFFERGSTSKDLDTFIDTTINELLDSKGYECV